MSDPNSQAMAIKTQEALVAFLRARQCFDSLGEAGILGRRKGNIVNDIDAAVAELSVCIYVLPGKPVKLNPNLPGPYCDAYELRVRVIENPALNETKPSAYELYEFVLRETNGIGLQIDGVTSAIWPSENNGDEQPDPERVIIDAILFCSLSLPQRQNP
jgi:hypothetical protein